MSGNSENVNIYKLQLNELRDYAKSKGIKYTSKLNKEAIYKQLEDKNKTKYSTITNEELANIIDSKNEVIDKMFAIIETKNKEIETKNKELEKLITQNNTNYNDLKKIIRKYFNYSNLKISNVRDKLYLLTKPIELKQQIYNKNKKDYTIEELDKLLNTPVSEIELDDNYQNTQEYKDFLLKYNIIPENNDE